MCGPLALSVPFTSGQLSRRVQLATYFLAKAIAYGAIGATFGLLGKGLFLMKWQQGLSVAAGIFIILLVCLPVLKPKSGSFLFRKQFSILYRNMQQSPRLYQFFLLGFMNGFLPCGLVYTALAAAMVTGGVTSGFISMFLFGMGTAPALISLILLKNKIGPRLRSTLRPVSIVVSVMVGILLILRGLNLGIPYVSPEVHSDHSIKNCCHK
jgi:sulfite exporter TauE/SafE